MRHARGATSSQVTKQVGASFVFLPYKQWLPRFEFAFKVIERLYNSSVLLALIYKKASLKRKNIPV